MIVALIEVAYVFSAIAVRHSSIAVPVAILEVSFIVADESVICSSLAFMLLQNIASFLPIAILSTLAEASNVLRTAIIFNKFSAASHLAFDPLAFKSEVLSHTFTEAVPLVKLEVSFIRVFIASLRSAMAMPQAILELTNVDIILDFVDIFKEAIPDSCFKFTDVSSLKFYTLERLLPDAVHSSISHLTLIS